MVKSLIKLGLVNEKSFVRLEGRKKYLYKQCKFELYKSKNLIGKFTLKIVFFKCPRKNAGVTLF